MRVHSARPLPIPKRSSAVAATMPAPPAALSPVYADVVRCEPMAVTTLIGNFVGGSLAAAVSARERNDSRAISRHQAPATTFCGAEATANNATKRAPTTVNPLAANRSLCVEIIGRVPPLPTDSINPGLLDGLIAAEQILRAIRGADEKRPSSRNSHGTCAAGSRPARGPRSCADPFLRSRKPTFRSAARDRQARSKRCRNGAALRVPPATRADSLLLATLRGDVVHDVVRAC